MYYTMPTKLITLRLPEETLADLDERAESSGASRSDYLRTLIALGLEIDVNAIRRTRRGIDELAPIKHSDTGLTLEIDNPPGTVLAVTDEALDAIRAEVNSIGVNYNQVVKSLKRFAKKYARNKYLSETERSELQELLDLTGKRTRLVYRRAMELAAKTDTLLDRPSVRLEVKMRPIDRRPPLVGEGQKQTPDNKTPESKNADRTPSTPQPAGTGTQRRHRVRGKKRRHDGALLRPSTPTVSQPKTKADLLHPIDKPAVVEPAASRHPGESSNPTLETHPAPTPAASTAGGLNGHPYQSVREPAPTRPPMPSDATPQTSPAVTPSAAGAYKWHPHSTPADYGSESTTPPISDDHRDESRPSDRGGDVVQIDSSDWPTASVPESLDDMLEAKTEEAEIGVEIQKHRRF